MMKSTKTEDMPIVQNSVVLVKRTVADRRTREVQQAANFLESLISSRVPNSPRLTPTRRPELW